MVPTASDTSHQLVIIGGGPGGYAAALYGAGADAYEQALERQPELSAALHNKALVEEALRQRQTQQQSGEPGQQQPSREEEVGEPNAPPTGQAAGGAA